MYLDYNETDKLSQALAQEKLGNDNLKLAVFPTALSCVRVLENLANSSIGVGAQNVAWVTKGAYTGAISAQMFKDLGCKYALVGHSERRYIFGETDDGVRKKIEACFDVGLVPVVCVGETTEDRAVGKREYRLKKQIMKAFADLDLNSKEIVVAYEPVWAISKAGVGQPCSAAEADDVHGWIKQELKQYTDKAVPVIYGGSADAKNVISYLSQPMIDGVLPGNASTKFETFVPLVREAEKIL